MAVPNYTPKRPTDIVYDSDDTRNLVMNLITGQQAFPSYGCNGIVLYGSFGTGKSTLAAMLPDAIEQARGGHFADATVEKISAENCGVDLISSLTIQAETLPFGQYRYFILDEADLLSNPAKRSMKNLMDKPGTVWVFTTNDLSGIDGGVKDRSHLIAFNAAPANRWLPLARRIVTDLGVSDLTDAALEKLISVQSGSARKIVNTIIELAQTVRVDRGLPRL